MEFNDILLAGVFFLGGIIVTLLGTIISNYLQHRQKLRFMKEEVFYNKKLSIFQKIAEAIEDAIGSYAMIYSLSSSENLEKLAEHIINSRKSINEKDINKKLIEILKRFEKDNKINKLEFHGTSLFLEEEIKLTGLLSQFILQNMSIFGIAVAISKGDKNKIGFLQELISSNKQRGDLLLKMMKKELKP